MSVPALNASEIAKIKEIAAFYKISVADFARKAIREYIEEKQNSLFYSLRNAPEASPEESAELLAWIESMSEEDHEVVRVDKFIPV